MNTRLLDLTIHESKYIGHSGEATDFTIEVEIGDYLEEMGNQKFYLHITKDGLQDIFSQFDKAKSRCGLVSDKDRIDKIIGIGEQLKAFEGICENHTRRTRDDFERMNRAIDLLEKSYDSRLEAITKRLRELEPDIIPKVGKKKKAIPAGVN